MRNILLIAVLLIVVQSNAQRFGQKISGGLNASLGIPSGEFKKVNTDAALGIRGHIMYNPSRNIPMYFGFELGYSVMGSAPAQTLYDGWDYYRLTASSNIFTFQFKFRLQQPKIVSVRPFAEGIIGWNDFFSSVNIERETYYGPGFNNGSGDSSPSEWAMTFGGAAGLDIKLNKEGNLWIEVKTAYMIGRKAKYYTDPHITSAGVTFTPQESETNMVIPQVGIKFGL